MSYHCLIRVSNTTLNNTINLTMLQPQMCNYHSRGSSFVSIPVAALETDSCKISEIQQFIQKTIERGTVEKEKNALKKKKSRSFVEKIPTGPI